MKTTRQEHKKLKCQYVKSDLTICGQSVKKGNRFLCKYHLKVASNMGHVFSDNTTCMHSTIPFSQQELL